MASPILKYEASAGSGKTYRLALEYLARLLLAFTGHEGKPQDPRRQRELLGSILAITFTVKAAQEMKERIVQMLKRFALSTKKRKPDKDDAEFLDRLSKETGLAQGKIIELAVGLIELVLASYDDFNVTTIDSLMSAMVKAVSPDLDLPADYEIAVDASDEMTSRGRAMLATLADGDWERLKRFLEELRSMDPRVAWKTDDAIVAKVTALFRRTLQQEGSAAVADDLRLRMAASWRFFLQQLRPLFPILQEKEPGGKRRRYVSGTYLKEPLLDHTGMILEGSDDLSGLRAFIQSTFFRKQDPRELLIGETPDFQRERFAAAYRPAQLALQEAVLAFSAFKTLPYHEFLGNFRSEWNKGKRTLFVEEFSHALAGLFDRWREEAFPYLYLKLSDRFSSFLFDEFQDTSTLQFRALAPLIDEVLSRKESGSLFIVGDRKQAIYRWRGGNSELMEEGRLRAEVPAIDNLSRNDFSSSLGMNWRSRGRIVDFNNDFWAPENISRITAENDLQQALRINFRGSKQELPAGREREGGFVELSLHVEAENDHGEEAGENDRGALSEFHLDEVESIIHRLHDKYNFKYSDIAVLVRKNDQVRAVIRRLGRKKIDCISDQSLMLGANPRVAEIIAFLRFLDYPPDNLNFFSFIRGELFRAAAGTHFGAEMTAFSEEMFIHCQGPFYKLFKERFPGTWKGLIEPFFQSVGFLPPYDLFSDMTQVFSIYENFKDDTPFFLALGDALHCAERDGGSSSAGFLRQWRKMVENEETPSVILPENTPGVHVLTMHQSKGLEFPAVIVPINDSGARGDDNLHWDQDGLFYISGDIAQAHPDLKERYERENIRSSVDLLNLLYVAFTRAREALFVPVAVSKGIRAPGTAADGLVRKILRASDAIGRHPLLDWAHDGPQEPYRRGKLEKKEQAQPQRTPPAAITSKRMLTRSWQSRYLVFQKAEAKERRDRSGAERGERFHELLFRLGAAAVPGELAARARALATEAGWPAGDIEIAVDFLRRDDVLALLSRGSEVHLEKEIVENSQAGAEFRRLDRLQIGTDEVLVIDFKTGPEKSEGYRSQLTGYLDAVAPLFPGRKCRGYLLYVDRGEVEEVPCSN
ncbi:MAG: UvrD-helicase domain-containing protein [Acidobacteria bacterium]|jgi:ATP-dependent exoDNAse (exonuclease V) beta subunit|nr:UvrD-helicase domain-containing protein [Acidobacteriota bacterium]